jgi:hypothetical protein
MLMPSEKPLFENVSSKEYYARAAEMKSKLLDGCIHIIFPDFEEAIIFSGGDAVTAIHESNRWLTVGDELVEPAENKAIAAEGRMSAYQLPPGLLQIFTHKFVKTMAESELGPYLTARLLIGYLEGDKSTCVLKLQDKRATGYVFLNFGKRSGAVYDSPEGRSYDDNAIKDMDRFKEHTSVSIYFTELTEKYLRSKAEAKAEARAVEKPVAPVTPVEPVSPFPIEVVKPVTPPVQSIKPIISKPIPVPAAPKPSGVRLVVAMSEDRSVGLAHRSRQQTLEALDESDVAWVDGKTLASLHMIGRQASIVLPGGREYTVTLKEVAITPGESRYIILPRKLRARLSVNKGTVVEVKA